MSLLATILPQVNKFSLNETLVLGVQEYVAADVSSFSFSWIIDNEEVASLNDQNSANPILTPHKLGAFKLTVYCTYTLTGSTEQISRVGSRVMGVSFGGLRFGPLLANTEPLGDTNTFTFEQTPLNLEVANLRAKIAPCLYWRGPVREYAVLSVRDLGMSDSFSTEDKRLLTEYSTIIGFVVTAADVTRGDFSSTLVDTVQPLSSFTTLCSNSAASPWSLTGSDKPFPRCNGAKPGNAASADETVGRCPFYTGPEFKTLFDDLIGFKNQGADPKISANQIQEIRIKSDNWNNYNDPLNVFKSRFQDPKIWAWTGYYTDPVTGKENKDILKVREVYVDSAVSIVTVGPELIIDKGTISDVGVPNYPTLIKELSTSINNIKIDFPKNPQDNPFVCRQFTIDKNYLDLYGHIPSGRKTIYAVNVTKAKLEMGKQGLPVVVDKTEDAIGGLTHEAYIEYLQQNLPEVLYTSSSNDFGNFTFGLKYDTNNEYTVDVPNRIELVYSSNNDDLVNVIRVYCANEASTDGSMFVDTTYVKCRFLHGWIYQSSFSGSTDNSDSKFDYFSAGIDVQLASGFESIKSFLIASPDKESILAAWKRGDILGTTDPLSESYYLEKLSKTTTILSEDIHPLYGYKDFIVRVADTDANRLSKWHIESIVTVVSEGVEIKYNVVDHTINGTSNILGEGYKGISYPDNSGLPCHYLHIKVDEATLPDNFYGLDFSTVTIQLTFTYFVHRDTYGSSPTGDTYDPLDITVPLNVRKSNYYNITPDNNFIEDGLSEYGYDEETGDPLRPIPLSSVMKRTYTITGQDIPYRIRYIVLFTDEEGRLIGKKESAVLFIVSVPTCGDIEIQYAWAPVYKRDRILPIVHRFCDWGCGDYPYSGVTCNGTPSISLGTAGPALRLGGNCFDHGTSLDRNWWPFNSCYAPTFQEPQQLGSAIFETIALNKPSWYYKYLAGYNFVRESTVSDSGYFWDCFFGLKYANYYAQAATFNDFAGAQAIRSGDMRYDITEGAYGHKGGGIWLWGTERERKVVYTGISKVMNFLDIITGFVSIQGTDGIDGLAYLTEPAGVDLNGIATEDFIHPFHILKAKQIAGFDSNETYSPTIVSTDEEGNPILVNLRKDGRYYLTSQTGFEDVWRYPIIQWWFDNSNLPSTGINGETIPAYRSEPAPGKQVSWVYLDKKVKDIVRGYSSVISDIPGFNLTLKGIRLNYPADSQAYIGAPDVFPGSTMLSEKHYNVSFRPEEGSYYLKYFTPSYNVSGKLIEHSQLLLESADGIAGPKRSLLPNGYFKENEYPYDSNLPVSSDIDVDSFLATDPDNIRDTTSPVYGNVPGYGHVKAKRRGLVVKTPVSMNNLPYSVLNIVGSDATLNPNIGSIKSLYQYSLKPIYGPDSTYFADPGFVNPPYARYCRNGAITVGRSGSLNAGFGTNNFTTVFSFSQVDSYTADTYYWEPYVESVEITFLIGEDVVPNIKGVVPDISLYTKTFGDTYSLVATKTKNNLGTRGRVVSVVFDNLNLNVKDMKLLFSSPSDSTSGATLISKIIVNARIQIQTTEAIETFDRKYVPSLSNKEDGATNFRLPGADVTGIAGLLNSSNTGAETTLAMDTYKGDARRFISFGLDMVRRPIIPNRIFDNEPFVGSFKSGRVIMDQTRGDYEVAGSNFIDRFDLCNGSESVGRRPVVGSGRGPLECMQEGLYLLAHNSIPSTASYNYFMHPDELDFFQNELFVLPEIIPGNTDFVLSMECIEPPTLETFRGDSSRNYVDTAGPFNVAGHTVTQQRTGSCWCYVGKVSLICGTVDAPCAERFVVHEHKGGSFDYISDMGYVFRKFMSLLGYAFFLTWSDGLLLLAPELVGQNYVKTSSNYIFTYDYNPSTKVGHITVTGNFATVLGHPFFYPTGGPSYVSGIY